MTNGEPPRRVIDGRFELLERLGGGGMGLVWRAHDIELHREVALKEVRPPDPLLLEGNPAAAQTLRERVLREARALARLQHPQVVTIFHIVVSTEVEHPWLVMELVRGGSLADRLNQRGPLDPVAAARLGRGLLSALNAAHAAGILHRDVKPENVLLRPDGSPVLTDFGIAALRELATLTATGDLIGSPEYIPPERIRGHEGDPSSDLWSLGMLLYVAVEGRHPLRRATALATLAAVLDESVPPPRRAGALGPTLTALLDRDPAARPDAERLDQLLAQVEAEAKADPRVAVKAPRPVGTAPETAVDEAEAGEAEEPADAVPAPRSPTQVDQRPAAAAVAGTATQPDGGQKIPVTEDTDQDPRRDPAPDTDQDAPPDRTPDTDQDPKTPSTEDADGDPRPDPAPDTGRGPEAPSTRDVEPSPASGASTARSGGSGRRRRPARAMVVTTLLVAVAVGLSALFPSLPGKLLDAWTKPDDGSAAPPSASPTPPGDATTPPSDDDTASSSPSAETSTQPPEDLSTPQAIRKVLKALRPSLGGSKALGLYVFSTQDSRSARAYGQRRYDGLWFRDTHSYQHGEVEVQKSNNPSSWEELIDLDAVNWDALPELKRVAQRDLNLKKIIGWQIYVEPNDGEPYLRVIAEDRYGSAEVNADLQGKVLRTHPREL